MSGIPRVDATPPPVHNPRRARAADRIAFVAIVVAVLAPAGLLALGAVRESGRRTQCQNNLHQIGVALQGYHEVHGAFPVGCVEWRPFGNTTKRQLAWSQTSRIGLADVALISK